MIRNAQMTAPYSEWKGWSGSNFASLTRSSTAYFDGELRRSSVPDKPVLRVLEIGFGNGEFAQYCRQLGWEYSGTEVDDRLTSRAQAAGFHAVTISGALLERFEPGQYDLIAAFDVLEHLRTDELQNLLAECKELLAGGGRFVARFPSGDSPFSLAMQNSDLTHQAHIGTGIIQQLCLTSGLKALRISGAFYPVRGVGFRRSIRRVVVVAGRKVAQPLIQGLFLDGKKRVLDSNMVVTLANSDEHG